MRMMTQGFCLVCALSFVIMITGCGDPAPKKTDSGAKPDAHGHNDDSHAEHAHGGEHKGPHGGQVIDVGRGHKYHAEIVEDEAARSITVYMLDKDLKELVIDQPTIAINLTMDGAAKTFELTAAGEGKSSEFKAADTSLFEALHEHHATGKLRVTIDGMPYSGEIARHDHAGHGHKH